MNYIGGADVTQAVGVVKWRKVNKNFRSSFQSKFNGWNHIAVCRNYNGHITIMIVGIIDNLGSDSYIRFFLFISLNKKTAIITLDGLSKVFS